MGWDARFFAFVAAAFLAAIACAADPPPPVAYGFSTEQLVEKQQPIDLPTALRLVDANSPAVAIARARCREAYARLELADTLWLPTLSAGISYYRLDGNTQNQSGSVFNTNRANLFAGGSARLHVDTADACFAPLIMQRAAAAASHQARAVSVNASFDVASAYFDLLQAHESRIIFEQALARSNQMLERAQAAVNAGLSKTAGDANRAATEVRIVQELLQVQSGRVGVASARLVRLLDLNPAIKLVPGDTAVVPITLIPPEKSLDDLILAAWAGRPEMAAQQALVAAACERLRQAKLDPLMPKLQIEYNGGTFGGGTDTTISDYKSRSEVIASAMWELKNLGLGNRAIAHERHAQLDAAGQTARAVRAEIAAEVAEAARIAAARIASLPYGEEAVKQASELYRKLLESSFGMASPQPKYDAIEPLLAIQALHRAQLQYLDDVIEYNRAQFRLYTAMGCPAESAMP